jgi:hypothetical protein
MNAQPRRLPPRAWSIWFLSRLQADGAGSSLESPRATIFNASSGNGCCSAFASSHGARSHASHSSAVVSITGIAFEWIGSTMAFKSYDPASGIYLGFDGLRYPCDQSPVALREPEGRLEGAALFLCAWSSTARQP